MAEAACQNTIAIATGILGKATETGARRHIDLLFGGNTVVLCERREEGFETTRPLFVSGEVVHGPLGRIEHEAGKLIGSLLYASSGVPFGRTRRAMEAFLREHDATAILAEFGHIGAKLAPVAADMGLPLYMYLRGFDASKRLRSPRVVRRYQKAVPKLAGIISVSRSLIENLAAKGVTHPNSIVIPTGVDVDMFRPGEKDPNLILTVGRLVAKKAPLTTIDTFAAMAREFPAARLEIIGDGDLMADCRNRAATHGLTDRIVLHGHRDRAFVQERLARASVFLLHSVTDAAGNEEGLPTAIQEAMASGAAVISTRHAGIPDLIEQGRTGLLVEENDAAAYREALHRLLEGEGALAAELARNARGVAEERLDFRKLHVRLEAFIIERGRTLSLRTPAS